MLATVCRYPAAVFFIIISFFLSFKEVFTCILISPVPARALNKRAGVCDKVTTKDESHVGGACRPVSSGSSYMFSRACSASQTSVEDLVYPYILLIFGKNTSLAFLFHQSQLVHQTRGLGSVTTCVLKTKHK